MMGVRVPKVIQAKDQKNVVESPFINNTKNIQSDSENSK